MKWPTNIYISGRSTTWTLFHCHQQQRSNNNWTKQEDGSHICGKKVGSFSLIHEDMNSKMGVLLWLMPLGNSMDRGKEYDDMIGCAICSLSQRLMQVLLPCVISMVSSCFNPHVYLMAEQWTLINSVDTFLYPYALPLLSIPFTSSSLCLSVTWAQA